METLLKKVYEEFKQFYKYKHRKPSNYHADLKIKKEETVTRPKLVPDSSEQQEVNPIQAQFNHIIANTPMQTMNSFEPNNYSIQPKLTNPTSFYPSNQFGGP